MSDQDKQRQLTDLAKRQRMTPGERADANPKNLKLAIAAKCFDCRNKGAGVNVTKALVRDCAKIECDLWRFRGWQDVTTRKTTSPHPHT